MNNIKVFVLMAGLTALFGAVGASVGGQGGMVTATQSMDPIRPRSGADSSESCRANARQA